MTHCVICEKKFKVKKPGDEAVCSPDCAEVTRHARITWMRYKGLFGSRASRGMAGVDIDRIHRVRS